MCVLTAQELIVNIWNTLAAQSAHSSLAWPGKFAKATPKKDSPVMWIERIWTYSLPKNNSQSSWKLMVGRCISYWNSPFSGAMLVSGRVFIVYLDFPKHHITSILPLEIYHRVTLTRWTTERGLKVGKSMSLMPLGVTAGGMVDFQVFFTGGCPDFS